MKQLVPTSLDEYIAEHKEGDVVMGRMMEISDGQAGVELSEGIQGSRPIFAKSPAKQEPWRESRRIVERLVPCSRARWKGGAAGGVSKPEAIHAGNISQLSDCEAGYHREQHQRQVAD